jgi:hypothetical protein
MAVLFISRQYRALNSNRCPLNLELQAYKKQSNKFTLFFSGICFIMLCNIFIVIYDEWNDSVCYNSVTWLLD